MRVLTVQGWWAWAIAHGYKTVENRKTPVSYRGTLAIRCGASRDWDEASAERLTALGIDLPPVEELDALRGKVICLTQLVDCVDADQSIILGEHPGIDMRLVDGPVCWLLSDIYRLRKPANAPGAKGVCWQGLVIPSPELAAELEYKARVG